MDVLALLTIVLLFALGSAYISACDRLKGDRS